MGQLPKDGMYNLVAIQPHFLMTTLLEYIEAPVLCIEPQRQFSTVYDVYSSIIYDPSRSNVSNLVPITPLIDYKVIREWIDLYVRNHWCDGIRREKTSTYDTNVRDLKVIDCKNRLVGDLPTTASYVTLSYVWGKPDVHVPDQQSHIESPDSYFLSPSLPRTIEDAINVTLALGYDYLWVDRYCLNKCSKHFHEQLRQMDKIYAGSALTLIAAAGSDGSYELPGVSRQRVANQPFYCGQRMLESTPVFTKETLESTAWSSRGWTYQEGLLPSRRLVFSDTQLYFQCQKRFRMEGWLGLEGIFAYRRASRMESLYDWLEELDSDIFPTATCNAMIILSRIEAFTKRSLTYESDVLNAMLRAFASLRQDGGIPHSGLQHLWGLPYCGSDSYQYLSDTPVHVSCRKFVSNLSWDVDFPTRRRIGFLSWSWTGWVGTARWGKGLMVTDNGRIWRTRFALDTPCTVSLELQNGDIIDWRNYQANYDLLGLDKDAPNTQLLSQYIHISVYITRVMPLPMPQYVQGTSRCYYLKADLESEHEDSPPIRVDIKSTA
jgi:hypothetical protein